MQFLSDVNRELVVTDLEQSSCDRIGKLSLLGAQLYVSLAGGGFTFAQEATVTCCPL